MWSQVRCARTPWRQLVGLLGQASLKAEEGLWLVPCRMVHTVGMRFPIDVLFLDPSLRVVALREAMAPLRIGRPYFRASSVLEVAAGAARERGVQLGDQVKFV